MSCFEPWLLLSENRWPTVYICIYYGHYYDSSLHHPTRVLITIWPDTVETNTRPRVLINIRWNRVIIIVAGIQISWCILGAKIIFLFFSWIYKYLLWSIVSNVLVKMQCFTWHTRSSYKIVNVHYDLWLIFKTRRCGLYLCDGPWFVQ